MFTKNEIYDIIYWMHKVKAYIRRKCMIEISNYMKGIIFRTQCLLKEIQENRKDVGRFLTDCETILLDYDEQKTKWFQGSETEIIFRIYDFLNSAFDYVILPQSIRANVAQQYATTEVIISNKLIEALERKRGLSREIQEREEYTRLLEDLQNLYYASYTQSDAYCRKKVVTLTTFQYLQEKQFFTNLERFDAYGSVVSIYFLRSSTTELPKLYRKLKKDSCTAIENWCGAVETGHYYVVLNK